MRNLPVHWSEGLFLRPQHFQASDRHWEESGKTAHQWGMHYHYGIRALELSPQAIANSQLEVIACHARMKDGTLVTLDAGQTPDRVDLKAAFAGQDTVRVYLAVPKLKGSRENVAKPGMAADQAQNCRFVEVKESMQDESRGGNDQEIPLRALNVKLLLSTDDTEGHELLPIVQLNRAGQKEAAPEIDVSYIPPVLAIDAWGPLGRDIVRAIYDIIGKKMEVVSRQVISRGITLVSQEPGDLERLLMLTKLNEAYSLLAVLAFAQGVHPFAAYSELCRIVGQLSIFGEERCPPDIPQYDHDDLGRIFYYIKEQIERLLGTIRDYQYEQRFFVGEGDGMRVNFESQWLGDNWQWFVGAQAVGLSRKEILAVLSPGRLDWKLGSAMQVDAIFRHGAEGVRLTPLEQAPRALPPSNDWAYYEVSRGNAAWQDVLKTETLAMRLTNEQIDNRDNLQGERKLVISVGRKKIPMQFALFAVPKK